jgi:acetyl esterase/lipase
MGFSAGAHLSVRVSTDFTKRFYTPVDEVDAVSCRPDFALIIYPAYLHRDGFTLAPELPVTAQTPPTFLLQAQDDKPYVDSSLAYFIALKAAGVPAEMHLFPDGGHGYGLRKRQKSTDAWPDLAATWLRRVTQ